MPAASGWAGFRQRHLFDYGPSAMRLWLALVASGVFAVAWSLVVLAGLPWEQLLQVVAWTALVGCAAAFPIEVPRTRQSIACGDALIFLLLALHGPAAAVLAASVEGGVAAVRGSTRLTSRLGTFAASAFGIALAGIAFELARGGLQTVGVDAGAAGLAALVVAALVYFPAQTMPQMQIFCLKRGSSLRITDWFEQASGIGALFVASAVFAGLLSLAAHTFGLAVVVVAVAAIAVAVAMIRRHFGQQAREHAAQEARVEAAQRESRQNQRRFHAAFSDAAIGMSIADRNGCIVQVNAALCSLLGVVDSELLGRRFDELMHPGDAALLARRTAALLARHDDGFSIELRCIGVAGREIWVSLHCALFDDDEAADEGCGLIFQLHDITSRRRAEGELQHIAYHDSLTDLANRNCFQERLRMAVEAQRDAGARFAVMYLDLDRFKRVNDSLGHSAGDELLKVVARRLQQLTRPKDLVARLGGDEFAILVEGGLGQDAIVELGERILSALDLPVRLGATDVQPRASIGITLCEDASREPEAILRDADLAMYQAKGNGKGRLSLFDASLHQQIGHRLQLEADLRRAIGDGDLTLAYQALYQLQPRRLIGFEALARWTHPTRGVISPALFIALAEESGCIDALTAWAIDEAARQLAEWRAALPGSEHLVMHINVSGKDLCRPHFVDRVRQTLVRHRLPASSLTLEITESTLVEERDRAIQALADLRELGVKLGIDDFGTGYSSLAYLSTLPFDCLKIDRSFVMGVEASPQNLEIVRTVVSLGRSLNKHVVAEGIETEEQLQILTRLGATIGQGYLLARPLPPERAAALFEQQQAVAA
ncbi:putative bifunctional diguanylate cyclase/phosphodiesterase [Piscinibacter sakaiensis]|uniref:putative bifunctional diguanylate cyclase/phosphodiesterase n=1 Tax=Piscinibacter sakaiensis TaxID=1547922 RepID=UPI003AAE1D67